MCYNTFTSAKVLLGLVHRTLKDDHLTLDYRVWCLFCQAPLCYLPTCSWLKYCFAGQSTDSMSFNCKKFSYTLRRCIDFPGWYGRYIEMVRNCTVIPTTITTKNTITIAIGIHQSISRSTMLVIMWMHITGMICFFSVVVYYHCATVNQYCSNFCI